LHSFSEVTDEFLRSYLLELNSQGLNPRYIARRLNIFSLTYIYRSKLSYDALTFPPFAGRSIGSLIGAKSDILENVTPRIPEPVMGPMLFWALRYVECYAETILAAVEKAQNPRPFTVFPAHTSPTERLAAYLEHLATSGRGLPDLPPSQPVTHDRLRRAGRMDPTYKINLSEVAREIGLRGLSGALAAPDSAFRTSLRKALTTLGFDWERVAQANPQSLEAVLQHGLSGKAARLFAQRLAVASYIVIGYLSGMRDAELQSLRVGCVRRVRSADGLIERWKIHGRVYKNVRDSRGVEAEWVVIEPVVKAIQVLERLHALYWPGEVGFLFTNPWAKSSRGQRVTFCQGINHLMNVIRDHANVLASGSADLPTIPDHDGQPWRFSARQLRRTVAWHIANRPFGVIAGMHQYKHASVAMFEGYAGLSSCGFKLEVEQERALAALDALYELYEDWNSGVAIAGPGGGSLSRDFEFVRQQTGNFPGMIADEARSRALLKNKSKQLHVGMLNDCVFRPENAMCLRGTTGADREGPRLTMCEPTRCSNAVMRPAHVPHWERMEVEIENHLHSSPGLSELQMAVLERDRERVRRVIEDANGKHGVGS
jgi:integrase